MVKDKESHPELHKGSVVAKLNWLRAAVLGANDGIVSVSGLVLGVAGATESSAIILTAGVAGILSGAISMAAGEYVSVSSSRDTEHAMIKKEKWELKKYPKEELEELAHLYEDRGLSPKTAMIVAKELTKKDPIKAHLDAELGIDPESLTNPWHAAFASAVSFLAGAIIPLIAILLPPAEIRIPVAVFSIILALGITGYISGRVSGANIFRAVMRIIIGGIIAMAVTYFVGTLFGIEGL